jgi:transcriptional regulator with XRE-family HTH domain
MLGEKLKKLRESKNISRKELGEVIGVTDKTIGKYERGEVNPSEDVIVKISDYFNVYYEYFTDDNYMNKFEDRVQTHFVNTEVENIEEVLIEIQELLKTKNDLKLNGIVMNNKSIKCLIDIIDVGLNMAKQYVSD